MEIPLLHLRGMDSRQGQRPEVDSGGGPITANAMTAITYGSN
jgi:hypothetical protein